MAFFEKQLTSEVKFSGKITTVYTDTVQLDNGNTAYREVVEHPGGVGIVALDSKNRVFMVRQYRYAVGSEMFEIPAGKMEKGEDPLECAIRELSEETGCTAGKVVPLGRMFSSPGFCNESLYAYLALDLSEGESHPDDDEFLTVERVPFDELCTMAEDGRLTDAKSVIGVLRARAWLEKNRTEK